MDGANVEIAQLVGPDNIYTFGASSDTVIDLYARGATARWTTTTAPASSIWWISCSRPRCSPSGDAATLHALWQDMKYKDWFMALLDVEDYIAAKTRALAGYEDRAAWPKRCSPTSPGRAIQRRPHHRAVQRRDLAAVRWSNPF